jgi:predicted DNA-binding transcriptional regulator AlpA
MQWNSADQDTIGQEILNDLPDHFLLTRDQVEAAFGLPKRFLETTGLKQNGPSLVRIGRSVRYRAGDVKAWIANQVVDPTSEA